MEACLLEMDAEGHAHYAVSLTPEEYKGLEEAMKKHGMNSVEETLVSAIYVGLEL